MKNLLLFVSCIVLLASCSDDDSSKTGAGLDGEWTMTHYSSSSGTLPVFEYEDVVYDFNLKENTLTIENNVEDEFPQYGLSGTYPLAVSPKMLSVEYGDYIYKLEYTFEEGSLVLRAQEGETGETYMKFDKITDLEL